jgi:hypothetical protein
MEINCCPRNNTSSKKRAGHRLLLHTSNIRLIGHSQTQVIYTLNDPRTDAVHYVGRTCNPKKRYAQHLSGSNEHCTVEKKLWVQELRALILRPRMDILETVDPPPIRVLKRERRWLYHYIQQRAPLTNFEAIACPHLVKAIQRSRADFLTAKVHSNVWYPLLRAEILDLTELRRIEIEAGRRNPFGAVRTVGKQITKTKGLRIMQSKR